MATTTPDAEQIMREYVAVYNEKAYEKIREIVSDSITVYDPGHPGVVEGRDAFETYVQELHEGFPDFHVTVNEMLGSEDLMMIQWTVTGTHEGEFNDVPPTGNEIEVDGMDTIRLGDGTIREHRVFYDVQGMLEQLGLTDE